MRTESLTTIEVFELNVDDRSGNGQTGSDFELRSKIPMSNVVPACYALLRLGCGDRCGYAECLLPALGKPVDLTGWSSFLQGLRQLTLDEAYETVLAHRPQWGDRKTSLVLAALRDLRRQTAATATTEADRYEPDELFHRSRAYYSVL